jgi:hypothetical protein
MTTLESLVQTIFRSFITKSIIRPIVSNTKFGNENVVKELTVVLQVDGQLFIENVAFECLKGIPYTFKYVNLNNCSANQNGAIAIYL